MYCNRLYYKNYSFVHPRNIFFLLFLPFFKIHVVFPTKGINFGIVCILEKIHILTVLAFQNVNHDFLRLKFKDHLQL